jgi:predicted RecB family endonuclease
MTETHMLKPYDQRVKSTYAYLQGNIRFLVTYRKALLKLRNETKEAVKKTGEIRGQLAGRQIKTIDYCIQSLRTRVYPKRSETGLPRLHYNRSKTVYEGHSFLRYLRSA